MGSFVENPGRVARPVVRQVRKSPAFFAAAVLGVVGIYGVIAYITAQRTREVGIRMALGAEPRDVARLFLRHGAALAGTGIALGIGAALLLSRLMASLLFGVGARDPVIYALVAGVLAAVAMLAGYLPSRRAARMHPVAALRSEM
jgi:putative ABC transport system permease protein